ncbi:MAG: flavin reductase family protein [Nitrospirota bacterium]|jgi:flavin reductase (DIM6/NTAB) family NADH-FMN oxidoreductase RutF
MTHDNESIGKAIGRIPSGLFIVTVRNPEGEETAFLASWVQQVAFEPPLVSVAIKKGRPAEELLGKGGSFVVNVVGQDNKGLIGRYAKGIAPGAEPFAGEAIERATTGAAILTEAAAYMDCRLHTRTELGDHILCIGEVVAGDVLAGDEPMVHLRRSGFDY